MSLEDCRASGSKWAGTLDIGSRMRAIHCVVENGSAAPPPLAQARTFTQNTALNDAWPLGVAIPVYLLRPLVWTR